VCLNIPCSSEIRDCSFIDNDARHVEGGGIWYYNGRTNPNSSSLSFSFFQSNVASSAKGREVDVGSAYSSFITEEMIKIC
jgi:hypothetical protein